MTLLKLQSLAILRKLDPHSVYIPAKDLAGLMNLCRAILMALASLLTFLLIPYWLSALFPTGPLRKSVFWPEIKLFMSMIHLLPEGS